MTLFRPPEFEDISEMIDFFSKMYYPIFYWTVDALGLGTTPAFSEGYDYKLDIIRAIEGIIFQRNDDWSPILTSDSSNSFSDFIDKGKYESVWKQLIMDAKTLCFKGYVANEENWNYSLEFSVETLNVTSAFNIIKDVDLSPYMNRDSTLKGVSSKKEFLDIVRGALFAKLTFPLQNISAPIIRSPSDKELKKLMTNCAELYDKYMSIPTGSLMITPIPINNKSSFNYLNSTLSLYIGRKSSSDFNWHYDDDFCPNHLYKTPSIVLADPGILLSNDLNDCEHGRLRPEEFKVESNSYIKPMEFNENTIVINPLIEKRCLDDIFKNMRLFDSFSVDVLKVDEDGIKYDKSEKSSFHNLIKDNGFTSYNKSCWKPTLEELKKATSLYLNIKY